MENNKNISPDNQEEGFLHPFGKGPSGFSTPSAYFDELPAKIMDRIHSSNKKRFFLFRPSFAIASLSSLAVIVVMWLFLKKDIVPAELELSENEIEHVVENPELYNIDDDVITEKYLSSNIAYEITDDGSAVPESEIRDYLEENTEASTIINEY